MRFKYFLKKLFNDGKIDDLPAPLGKKMRAILKLQMERWVLQQVAEMVLFKKLLLIRIIFFFYDY